MSETKEILEAQHKYFYTGETKKLAFRIAMLKRLEEAVLKDEGTVTGTAEGFGESTL